MVQIKATLSNPRHPDYGRVTVNFPIREENYDEVVERLERLEIGDAVERDCRVEAISGDAPILKRLEKTSVNVDELDYLAKRLDSFIDTELSQFQAAAVDHDVFDAPEFINLTFCCQEVTVITDFNDLEQIGRAHMMALNGGMLPSEAANIDFRQEALRLIGNEDGRVTPYGVVYDNGMRMADLYDGRFFPEYPRASACWIQPGS